MSRTNLWVYVLAVILGAAACGGGGGTDAASVCRAA
jgi:hypothetical protein